MRNDIDTPAARILLDKYYRAETSPEEETLLEDFFRRVDNKNLPEDMEADRSMFLMMDSLRPRQSQAAIPGDLAGQIDRMMNSRPDEPLARERSMPRYYLKYSGAAAAAVLIIAVCAMLPRLTDNVNPSRPGNLAEVRPMSSTAESAGGVSFENAVQASDGFIELHDPDEVRELMMEINDLLAGNFRAVDNAMSQTVKTIDDYKQITKSIIR